MTRTVIESPIPVYYQVPDSEQLALFPKADFRTFTDITNKEIQNGNININYPKNYLFLIISTCLFPFTTPYIIESVINMSMEEFYEKHYEYMKYILLKEIEILK